MSDAAEDEFAGLPEEEEEFDEAAEEGGEEAGSGDGDDGSVDSSEEEEDGENEYEADGFVVDEDEAEGDGEGDASDQEIPKAKKKKRRRQQFALDEEDYELLEDNQVRVGGQTCRPNSQQQANSAVFAITSNCSRCSKHTLSTVMDSVSIP